MRSLDDLNKFHNSGFGKNNFDDYNNFVTGKQPKSRKWLYALAGALLLGPCVCWPGGGNSTDKYYKKVEMDVNQINGSYTLTVNDDSVENPFIIDKRLVEIIKEETEDCDNDIEKAEAIFDWMESNVGYDKSKYFTLTSDFIRGLGIFGDESGYRNSKEVLDDEEGICGELAFLYVTMARSVGLESNYVSVRVDKNSDKVNHACAVVKADGKRIFVDPAYDEFDINHKDVRILSDKETIERYKCWRRK